MCEKEKSCGDQAAALFRLIRLILILMTIILVIFKIPELIQSSRCGGCSREMGRQEVVDVRIDGMRVYEVPSNGFSGTKAYRLEDANGGKVYYMVIGRY